MSVGLTLTKADMDQRVAGVVLSLRDALRRCSEMNALLNDTTIIANDAALTTMGYSSQEITWLRGSFTDLGGTGVSLYRIAIGAVAGPGSPNDFFFNAKHLTGVITS